MHTQNLLRAPISRPPPQLGVTSCPSTSRALSCPSPTSLAAPSEGQPVLVYQQPGATLPERHSQHPE